MSTATQDTEIGGFGVQVTQLPTFKAMRMFNRLCRVFVPGLMRVFGGKEMSLKTVLGSPLSALADGAAEILDKLTPDEQESIIREILGNAKIRVEDKWVNIVPVMDDVLRGRVDVAYQVVWFALSVNYSNFSDALSAAISAAEAKRAVGPQLTSPS